MASAAERLPSRTSSTVLDTNPSTTSAKLGNARRYSDATLTIAPSTDADTVRSAMKPPRK